jgi:pimeloyl-ACP methyl ester carboxylesterase
MTDHTHQTEPTQFVNGAGIRFAYRRFGKSQGVPLVFFQHFTGTMDNWDPAVTDGLARDREVILFNNAGISSSGGETPNTIGEMARDAGVFIDALALERIDLLGFSLGGFVAQQLTLDRPKQVRRLVLVGTGPRSGEGMASLTPEAKAIFGKTYEVPDELWLEVFFSPTENSQSAGRAFLRRLTHLSQLEESATREGAPEVQRDVEIEAAFKNLKYDLALRPIFHQLEHRIEAHIFVAFMAYCLHVTFGPGCVHWHPD